MRKVSAFGPCIGSIEADRPLLDDLRVNALAAAFRDPRFPPLEPEELDELTIEVSVLSRKVPLGVASEADLISSLRPGVDGLLLEVGRHRATFLPSVWKQLSAPEIFVRELKRKAGLPIDYWSEDLRLWRYTTTAYAE